MGLGKTMQTLALVASAGDADIPDLVICPASVVPVWQKEAEKHFPKLKVKILSKGNTFEEDTEPSLWVASYTQLRRHRNLLDKQDFRYAILDEAQLIKNPKAKVTQACLSIEATHRLALSGHLLKICFGFMDHFSLPDARSSWSAKGIGKQPIGRLFKDSPIVETASYTICSQKDEK